MERTNSPAFRRTLGFTRSRKSNGFLSSPTISFTLTHIADDRELGQLSIRGKNVTYVSATDAKEDFRLRKAFWSSRWYYEGSDEQEFGRYSFGWNFKPAFIFRSGERFHLKAKRRWSRKSRKPGEPSQTASFFREETPVMVLESFTPTPFFYNEVTAKMEGTIETDSADIRIISGMLLLFQTHIEARNQSAH